MNQPDPMPPTRSSKLSREAMVGLGITIGTFGVLFLLLGCAQTMRHQAGSAMILLVIGGVMFIVGAITALSGSKRSA